MPWKYTKTVLVGLARIYQTQAETLTTQEQAIAKRICNCCHCKHIWLAQRNKLPKRCEMCKSYTWNSPTIIALAGAEATPAKKEDQ